MRIEIPEKIEKVLRRLNEAGYEAYIVGGCVRDALMGRAPHDYDITTSALPEQTIEVFRDYTVIPTGLKHGTVTVLCEREPLEITTFRIDGEYSDSRRPDSVSFTRSVTEDLARRDFTMNAIAYSPEIGIVDAFGGEADIRGGIIRCVGDPDKRFGEDALRIMRALRFAVALGFEIEPCTAEALKRNCALLDNIAAERIYSELTGMLAAPKAGQNIRGVLREYRDIFAQIIPELRPCFDYAQGSVYHTLDLYEHIILAVETAAQLTPNEYALPLAMLLHDIGKPRCITVDEHGKHHYYGHPAISAEMTDTIMHRFKSSAADRELVKAIVRGHDVPMVNSAKVIRRRLAAMGEENLRYSLLAHIADDSAKAEFCKERIPMYYELLEKIPELAQQGCFTIKSLAVNGRDLSAIMKPSPEMGRVLNRLLAEVVDGDIPNEREALMKRAAELAKQ
ncbi:MAG: CCA tRNA nucleotidyltransferase [Oscillospiraceae bacterium]